jgi:hypothetical protein
VQETYLLLKSCPLKGNFGIYGWISKLFPKSLKNKTKMDQDTINDDDEFEFLFRICSKIKKCEQFLEMRQ